MATEVNSEQEPATGSVGAVTDEQLIAMLVGRARGDGLKLTDEAGLLQQLTKRVIESALDGEITCGSSQLELRRTPHSGGAVTD
ncbi:hypothetical protein [Micromonospora sp. NPDC051296]|uniref:hypothetical protein n=1 Tax=Micromonospora sp. NPDC051296 TaxID=3155046 RepID=UPI003446FA39